MSAMQPPLYQPGQTGVTRPRTLNEYRMNARNAAVSNGRSSTRMSTGLIIAVVAVAAGAFVALDPLHIMPMHDTAPTEAPSGAPRSGDTIAAYATHPVTSSALLTTPAVQSPPAATSASAVVQPATTTMSRASSNATATTADPLAIDLAPSARAAQTRHTAARSPVIAKSAAPTRQRSTTASDTDATSTSTSTSAGGAAGSSMAAPSVQRSDSSTPMTAPAEVRTLPAETRSAPVAVPKVSEPSVVKDDVN